MHLVARNGQFCRRPKSTFHLSSAAALFFLALVSSTRTSQNPLRLGASSSEPLETCLWGEGFLPRTVTNREVLIGLVGQYSEGSLEVWKITRFIRTLRASGSRAAVIFVGREDRVPSGIRDVVDSQSGVYLGLCRPNILAEDTLSGWDHNLEGYGSAPGAFFMRFLAARQLLHELPHVQRAALSDVTDVIFQGDPFSALSQGDGQAHNIVVSPEHSRWSENHSSAWLNKVWLAQCVRDDSKVSELLSCAQVEDIPVSCAGFTVGDIHGMTGYLDQFQYEYAKMRKLKRFPCNDQGLHNAILLSSLCQVKPPAHIIRNVRLHVDNSSNILTLDGGGSEEFEVQNDKAVSKNTGEKFAVVHQLPRCQSCSNLGHNVTEHTVVILLTMTLSPNTEQIARSSFELRLQDYISSIEQWGKVALEKNWKLVAVENSGIDSTTVEALQAAATRVKSSIEVVVLDSSSQQYCGSSNYGALEALAVKQAANLSKTVQDATLLLKVTGRIFVPNIEEVLYKLQSELYGKHVSAFVNLFTLPSPPHDSRPYIDTTVIAMTNSFLHEVYSNCGAVPLAKDVPIERTLPDFISWHCAAEGKPLDPVLLARCGIGTIGCVRRTGIRGWSNKPYADDSECS